MGHFVYGKAEVTKFLIKLKNFSPEYVDEFFDISAERFFRREGRSQWSFLDPKDQKAFHDMERSEISITTFPEGIQKSDSFSGKSFVKESLESSRSLLATITIRNLEHLRSEVSDQEGQDAFDKVIEILKSKL